MKSRNKRENQVIENQGEQRKGWKLVITWQPINLFCLWK